MFGFDYEYLRVKPTLAKNVQHPEDYVKKGEK